MGSNVSGSNVSNAISIKDFSESEGSIPCTEEESISSSLEAHCTKI